MCVYHCVGGQYFRRKNGLFTTLKAISKRMHQGLMDPGEHAILRDFFKGNSKLSGFGKKLSKST